MDTIRGTGNSTACAATTHSSMVARTPFARLAIPRGKYLVALGALFTLFSSARVLAYLPTIWAILASADSSQHSLLTWFTFFGSNATMAVWLWEHNDRRCNAAITACGGNALMCVAIIAVVAWARL